MFGFNTNTQEWEELPNYNKLSDMATDALLELFLAYHEHGDIEDDSFGFKLLDFYNAKGWLSDKQRTALIKIIVRLPELDKPVNDSIHLSEIENATYIRTVDDKQVRLCRTMAEYIKHNKL